jgi:hypothetical protein
VTGGCRRRMGGPSGLVLSFRIRPVPSTQAIGIGGHFGLEENSGRGGIWRSRCARVMSDDLGGYPIRGSAGASPSLELKMRRRGFVV